VIREAFALGCRSLLRGLVHACLVQDDRNGVLFTPGNAEDLLRRVRGAWGNSDLLASIGTAAREEFESRYTARPTTRC